MKPNPNKRQKVLICGNINGSYRSQNILKFLSDIGVPFACIPNTYYTPGINYLPLRRIISVLSLVVVYPFKIFSLFWSTHLFVLPMNNSFASLIELLIAKFLQKTIIVDFYLSIYDTNVNDRESYDAKSISGRAALFKDRCLLRAADKVIFLNQAEAEFYQSIIGVNVEEKSIHIVPLVVDFKSEVLSSKRSKADGFNVCWWGTFVPLHGLENLIKALSLVRTENVKLHIFGNSENASAPFRRLVQELNLHSKVAIRNDWTFKNGKLAPFLADNCDLAVGNFGRSDKAKTVLVNKVIDALSLGIPCLTIPTKGALELIGEQQGVIFSGPTPEEIAEMIDRSARDPIRLRTIGEQGLQKYLSTFSPDAFRLNLAEALDLT